MEDYQREFLMNYIPSYILLDELSKKIDRLCANDKVTRDIISPLEAKEKDLGRVVNQHRKDAEENVIKFTEMFDENAVDIVRINAYHTFLEHVGPCEDFDDDMVEAFISAVISKSEDHCRDLYNHV